MMYNMPVKLRNYFEMEGVEYKAELIVFYNVKSIFN